MLTCPQCDVSWTPAVRPPLEGVAASALMLVGAASALGMLVVLQRDATGLGGALGIGALVALGLGVKLRSSSLPRCPQCGRLGLPEGE